LCAILIEIEKGAYRTKPVAPVKVFEIIDMNIFECYNMHEEIVDVWLRRLSSELLI